MIVPIEQMHTIRERLLRCQQVYVLSHPSPDGDSIGSTAGLCRLLLAAGVEAIPVVPQPIPEKFLFLLSGMHWLPGPVDVTGKEVVVLDSSDSARLAEDGQSLRGTDYVFNIDHHQNNQQFGNLNLVDISAAATGLLIFELFADLNMIDAHIATALFTALYTDTGRFSYANTDSRVLAAAARLVDLGANPGSVYGAVYETRSAGYYNFLAAVLDKISLQSDGRLAILVLPRTLIHQFQLEPWEYDDLIDYPRSLHGVEVAVVAREEDERIRVSLRSKGNFDVSRIASVFGGGGHVNAAGASLKLPLDSALKQLESCLLKELNKR